MARFAKGSRALAISDRSGAAFPYREMVQEWTGAWVHISEFEPKQPQLEPHPVGADPQGLQHARHARVEFPVQDILPNNPFTTTAASKDITSPILNLDKSSTSMDVSPATTSSVVSAPESIEEAKYLLASVLEVAELSITCNLTSLSSLKNLIVVLSITLPELELRGEALGAKV